MTCSLPATVQSLQHPIVVIGYGNSLRRDDAIGPRIAEEVARWGVPNVRSLSLHQLTPELAETLSTAEMVIFVDACHTKVSQEVKVFPIQPPRPETARLAPPTLDHTGDPIILLALTRAVYGRVPRAWWMQVPAVDFDMGEQLSAIAQQGMADALEAMDRLIRSHSHPHPVAQT